MDFLHKKVQSNYVIDFMICLIITKTQNVKKSVKDKMAIKHKDTVYHGRNIRNTK
jgi:hypothetical protein